MRLVENPYREPRSQNGSEVYGSTSAYYRRKTLRLRAGSSKPNTQYVDADRTLGSVITQRRRSLLRTRA